MITIKSERRSGPAQTDAPIHPRSADRGLVWDSDDDSEPWIDDDRKTALLSLIEETPSAIPGAPGYARAAAEALGIVRLRNGLFRVGVARVNRDSKMISVPAEVNQLSSFHAHALVPHALRAEPSLLWTHMSEMDMKIASFLAGGFDLSGRSANRMPVTIEVAWACAARRIGLVPLHSLLDVRRPANRMHPSWSYRSMPLPTDGDEVRPHISLQPEAGALVSLDGGAFGDLVAPMGSLPEPGSKVTVVFRF